MPSPIEHIYEQIFGSLPTKSGAAYERLSAIALALLQDGATQHDARLRGQFSETMYQLDVHHKSSLDGTSTMGEAKDYSERSSKVGRGDLQKLAGALPDLRQIDAGAYFSATSYTGPARKYAQASTDITGKPITLYELAASTIADEQGFVKTIVIQMHISVPEPHNGDFRMQFTLDARKKLRAYLARKSLNTNEFTARVEDFYDVRGVKINSMFELTSKGYAEMHSQTNCAHASYLLPGHFFKFDDEYFEIVGLEFRVPIANSTRPREPVGVEGPSGYAATNFH